MDQRHLLMHQTMISDRRRLDAYAAALERTVQPGDTVIDVGAGTLALTLLALRAGAGHVYAIEADPQLVAVACAVVESNGLGDRVTVIAEDARRVRVPERAQVIVSELMGNLGPEEEMTEIVRAVARRNLAPDGVIVPRDVVTYLVAAELDNEGWGVWDADFYGFRLDAVTAQSPAEAQLHFFQRPPRLLSEPQQVDVSRHHEAGSRSELTVTTSGRMHGVLGYFEATLADGIVLSSFPSYPGCNWAVWVWPLRHTPVRAGDRLCARLLAPPDWRDVLRWRLDCGIRPGGGV